MGYKTVPVRDGSAVRKKLVPDEVYAPVVKKIFKMYLSGKGGKEIANVLNEEGVFIGESGETQD